MPYKDPTKQKEAQRRSYLRNRARIAERMKERRPEINARLQERRVDLAEWVKQHKDSTPCVDCGGSFISYAMEFDHVRGEKIGNVSDLVQQVYSLKVIQEEIAKCDVVCANCHRIRTHKRTKKDLL